MTLELAVLTSMITPAVLISACSALILSTSVRLGRVVDRVRVLSDRFEELAHKPPEDVQLYAERMELTFAQLDWLTSRARHLQRAMTTFYVSLGLFVATSVALGFVGLSTEVGAVLHWLPLVFAIVGAGLLFVGTLLLGFEAALALRAIHAEMDFLWKLGRHQAATHRRFRRGSIFGPGCKSRRLNITWGSAPYPGSVARDERPPIGRADRQWKSRSLHGREWVTIRVLTYNVGRPKRRLRAQQDGFALPHRG